jgi:hypothetical protein
VEEVIAAGYQFVGICLVANVPDDLVFGSIEYGMKRQSKLHDSQ